MLGQDLVRFLNYVLRVEDSCVCLLEREHIWSPPALPLSVSLCVSQVVQICCLASFILRFKSLEKILLLKNLFFNWRKIALQCCIGFCHTAVQISHNYTYIPSLWGFQPLPRSHSL